MDPKGIAVGIDLGTTNSCVGVFRNGTVEIINNKLGNRTTPSYVFFKSTSQVEVGEKAKENASRYPGRVVYDAKRLIGNSFKKIKTSTVDNLSYSVIDQDDNPVIKISFDSDDVCYKPEEVSSKLLAYLKESLEKYFNQTITIATITVPAYFKDNQIHATTSAAKLAGFKEVYIINEPTAAAYAYSIQTTMKIGLLLVLDIGGGTLDISIIQIIDKFFQTKAIYGDMHLGGEDFTNKLTSHFALMYEQKTKRKLDVKSMTDLRRECEKAKKMLSVDDEAEIYFEDNEFKLSRDEFEVICCELFDKITKCIDQASKKLKEFETPLTKVILVGGSSRMPKIQTLLESSFKDVNIHCDINADEAVAYGAAIAAGYHNNHPGFESFVTVEIIPFSLGISDSHGKFKSILSKHQAIPSIGIQDFTTPKDYITSLTIEIYEGDDDIAENNQILGSFILSDIEYAKQGVPNIQVTFTMGTDRTLKVFAQDMKTKSKNEITIQRKYSN